MTKKNNLLSSGLKSYKILKKINPISLVIIVFLTVIHSILPSISVLLFKELINSLQNRELNIKIITITLFINLISILIKAIISKLTFEYRAKITYYINIKIFSHIQNLNLKDFEKSETYNLILRADSQSNDSILNFFLSFIKLFSLSVSVITNAAILITWKINFVYLILFVSILHSLIQYKINSQEFTIRKERTVDERKKWYYGFIQKNDLAFKEIKVYNLYNFFIEKFQRIYWSFYAQDKKYFLFSFYNDLVFSIINSIIFISLTYFSILSAVIGNILIGDAISYIQGGNNIKTYTDELTSSISRIASSALYIDQLFDFFEFSLPNESRSKKISLQNPIKSIKLKKVSYSYSDKIGQKNILKDISLDLDKNTSYVIVGRNGSGKTTLIKLILGLYEDYEGEIYINDIPLSELDLLSYWSRCGILFQDYTKYEMTLEENIVLSNQGQIGNDTKRILSLLNLDHLHLNQQLGQWFDHGTQISGGEWLKVAITRVLNRNSSLIVLDEPNAALDNISEKKVITTLSSFLNHSSKIMIMISHRLKHLNHLNPKIIFLNADKSVSLGTIDELLNENEEFQNIYYSEKDE